MIKLFWAVVLCSAVSFASTETVDVEATVEGIVKKLDGDAVVLRVKDRNVRLSKRFFKDQDKLSVGQPATAQYVMTFAKPSSRDPATK